MKVLTLQEFMALEGNVIYAEVSHKFGDNNCYDVEFGSLMVRNEKMNATNWWAYRPMDAGLFNIAGTDDSDHDDAIEWVKGTGAKEMPYDVGSCRDYENLYHKDDKFIVLDEEDVKNMLRHLARDFPTLYGSVASENYDNHF